MPDWQVILSRDGPAAWRTAYRLLGNRADADECFQEACLAALDVCRRQPVHNWQGLLIRLAASRSVDRLRVNKRARIQESGHGLEQLRDAALPPTRQAEEAELADELRDGPGANSPAAGGGLLPALPRGLELPGDRGPPEHLDGFRGCPPASGANRLRKLLAKFQESCASTGSTNVSDARSPPTGKPEKGALMTTGANLNPGSAGDDDRLSRALAALRRTDVPAGPSAEVLARTLAAVEARANSRNIPLFLGRRTMFAALRIAASLVAAAVGVYLFSSPFLAGSPVTFAEVALKLQKAHTLAYTMTSQIPGQD